MQGVQAVYTRAGGERRVPRHRPGQGGAGLPGSGGRHGRVAQLAPEDLADVGLRQLGAELHHLGLLVAGEVDPAVALDRLGGQVRVLAHDHHLDRLARAFVRYPDGGDLEHAGHGGDHVLDLVRVYVEARDQDHVLLAVDDVEEALLVHLGHVAGVQPASRIDDLGGLLGAVPVAGHDLRAADTQLADLADRQSAAFLVLDTGVGGGDGQADRAVVVGQVHGVDAGGRRSLGQAVGLDQGDAGDLLPALGHRPLHRHAAAQGQVQAGEVHLVEAGGIEQTVEQGVDAGDGSEPDLAQLLDEALHVARVGDQVVQAAVLHEHQAVRGQREDVVQRQRGDYDFLARGGVVTQPARGLLHVRDQVAVGEHGNLGDAGGAAGV